MKNSKGGIEIIILLIVIIGSFAFVGGFSPLKKAPLLDNSVFQIQISPGADSKKSLQLKTLKFSKKCSEQITVDLLLDRSGSMGNLTPTRQTKIARLKEAVLALTAKLSDTSVIGIQSFDSRSRTDDVPISYYKDVKGIISSRVNALSAGQQTPTHDALAFSYQKLSAAIPQFPGRQFNFVLVSDGAPCPGVGCTDQPGANQDPRLYSPNPADQIKALGINVYTLGIYDRNQADKPALSDLLKSIASKPENYYEAQTGDQTTKLLEVISARICDQAT